MDICIYTICAVYTSSRACRLREVRRDVTLRYVNPSTMDKPMNIREFRIFDSPCLESSVCSKVYSCCNSDNESSLTSDLWTISCSFFPQFLRQLAFPNPLRHFFFFLPPPCHRANENYSGEYQ